VLCSPRVPYGLIAGMQIESFERIRLEVFKKWSAIVMPSDVIYVHEIDNFKLGSLLKERRIELNLTSIEISSFIGISNNAFRNYEKGLRTIPLNVLYALCELYKLNIKEILEESFL
jgi:DNA-binding XRE family transcriptional regulator